jgi:hypothetical protein
MNLWSVEKDSRYGGYFVWSGTTQEPLGKLHTATLTLLGAKFWIWREKRKPQPRKRSWIVFQVEK